MDVIRTKPVRRIRPMVVGSAAVVAGTAFVAIWTELRPAVPAVPRSALVIDSVVAGPLVRSVRASGSLVPEQIRWISAVAPGRVERKLIQPGAPVSEETIVLELSNPDVEIQLLQAERQLTDAQAQLISLQVALETQRLTQQGVVAQLRTQSRDAERTAQSDSALVGRQMVSRHEAARTADLAAELRERLALETSRLDLLTRSIPTQVGVQHAQVERLEAVVAFQRSLVRAMTVRAGTEGVLQELPLEVGQFATSGTMLAKVVQPDHLKAVLRVQENQARDVTIGQSASVDTRNGVIPGRVVRIDPASTDGVVSVDIELAGELPKGARPDLGVDGTIILGDLGTVLRMGRPPYGQENGTIGLFRLTPDGMEATRVAVTLGRVSSDAVEVVAGLNAGDRVILSDMSRFDHVNRVRLR